MDRTQIDGVPALVAAGRTRAHGALVFGVGLRDESYPTVGITHLLEHLVMGSLPRSTLDANATVDTDMTVFYATGRPEAVATFLTGVCRALADLPVDRLAIERGVLAAEDCAGAHPTVASLWAARHGLAGPGLVIAGGPVGGHLTAEQVTAHAHTWFTRENAVLTWEGPLPEELRLPLPDGPRPARPWPEPRAQQGPVWVRGPVPGVGMSFVAAGMPDEAMALGVDVLRERVADVARHGRGLSYHAAVERLDLPGARREYALTVDAREGQEEEVARIVWEQFWRLGEEGPTAEELRHAVEQFEEELSAAEADGVEPDLGSAAFTQLDDVPFRSARDALAAWRTVGGDRVAAAVRAVRDSAIVHLPGELTLRTEIGGIRQTGWCGLVEELPRGDVFRPNRLARALSKDARIALVVADDALAHQDADGDVHRLPWADVLAALPVDDGKGFEVVGRNLCSVVVHEDLYGRRALDRVRRQLPAHVWSPAQPVG